MEALPIYLLKSATWLTGFALVFILFLRNERFFRLNRLFLLAGILASFFLPLITIYYYIDLPGIGNIATGQPDLSGVKVISGENKITLGLILTALYVAGTIIMIFMMIIRSRSVLRSIKKSEVIKSDPVKLVRTDEFTGSFSFFSYVFVNPSVSDVETKEIVNHELGHIRQKHWVDLVLTEVLCVIQWFNPLSWIYKRFIRQNHEYLADAEALQRSSDPAVYRAALLNQIVGTPLFSLVNSFNYSLNKKRFKMMKNSISSPYRKMKTLIILPVFAVILFAFAKPEYRLPAGKPSAAGQFQAKEVNGTVVQQSGMPLQGAIITIRETTVGTVTDAKGLFKLTGVPDDGVLVVSYTGYKSKVVKAVFTSDMVIIMVRDTINVNTSLIPPPPPPPPPPPLNADGKKPLIVIDGKISTTDLSKIDPDNIQSISVLNDEMAAKKYGEKGKDGVLEITLKKGNSTGNQVAHSNEKVTKSDALQKDMFVVVEEMPQFPGGGEELMKYMSENIKYPPDAVKDKITGKVFVTFIVGTTGKISEVKVEQPVNPLLDGEAVRLISNMPDWKPGSQGGKTVDVRMRLPVEFKLK